MDENESDSDNDILSCIIAVYEFNLYKNFLYKIHELFLIKKTEFSIHFFSRLKYFSLCQLIKINKYSENFLKLLALRNIMVNFENFPISKSVALKISIKKWYSSMKKISNKINYKLIKKVRHIIAQKALNENASQSFKFLQKASFRNIETFSKLKYSNYNCFLFAFKLIRCLSQCIKPNLIESFYNIWYFSNKRYSNDFEYTILNYLYNNSQNDRTKAEVIKMIKNKNFNLNDIKLKRNIEDKYKANQILSKMILKFELSHRKINIHVMIFFVKWRKLSSSSFIEKELLIYQNYYDKINQFKGYFITMFCINKFRSYVDHFFYKMSENNIEIDFLSLENIYSTKIMNSLKGIIKINDIKNRRFFPIRIEPKKSTLLIDNKRNFFSLWYFKSKEIKTLSLKNKIYYNATQILFYVIMKNILTKKNNFLFLLKKIRKPQKNSNIIILCQIIKKTLNQRMLNQCKSIFFKIKEYIDYKKSLSKYFGTHKNKIFIRSVIYYLKEKYLRPPFSRIKNFFLLSSQFNSIIVHKDIAIKKGISKLQFILVSKILKFFILIKSIHKTSISKGIIDTQSQTLLEMQKSINKKKIEIDNLKKYNVFFKIISKNIFKNFLVKEKKKRIRNSFYYWRRKCSKLKEAQQQKILENKIIDYETSLEKIKSKISSITSKSIQCKKCCKFLSPFQQNNLFESCNLTMSISSARGEEKNKIHQIPIMKIKSNNINQVGKVEEYSTKKFPTEQDENCAFERFDSEYDYYTYLSNVENQIKIDICELKERYDQKILDLQTEIDMLFNEIEELSKKYLE